jgi:hypothetical protein
MVWDSICGGRVIGIAVGMAAVVLVMAGGAGVLMNDDSMSFVGVQAEVRA